MNDQNPYTAPSAAITTGGNSSIIRVVILSISWIAWLGCSVYWLYLAVVSFVPQLLPIPNANRPPDNLFSIAGAVCIAFAYTVFLGRRAIWFTPMKKPGVGFLLYQVFFYITVLAAIVAPYLNFIVLGQRDLFYRVGFLITGILLYLALPRLPQTKGSTANG